MNCSVRKMHAAPSKLILDLSNYELFRFNTSCPFTYEYLLKVYRFNRLLLKLAEKLQIFIIPQEYMNNRDN